MTITTEMLLAAGCSMEFDEDAYDNCFRAYDVKGMSVADFVNGEWVLDKEAFGCDNRKPHFRVKAKSVETYLPPDEGWRQSIRPKGMSDSWIFG